MATDVRATLRLRKRKSKEEYVADSDATVENVVRGDDVVWGKTPGGEGTDIHPVLSGIY